MATVRMALRKKFILVSAVLSVCAMCAGCGPRESAQQATVTNSSTDARLVKEEVPSETQKERMLKAKQELFQSLSSRLQQAVAAGGPAEAIRICQREAPAIANEVSEQHGLTIGRTGVRLRNQENVPPGWAKEMTAAKRAEPFFGVLSDGTAVGLLPIRLKGQCLMCHGPAEQIAPTVKERLAQLYPEDAAIGFQEGDLRGWFWVEVES
jgi:hypothetical protein